MMQRVVWGVIAVAVIGGDVAAQQGRIRVRKDVPAGVVDFDTVPPPLAREMRGVWVATVGNMDWPSRPGLSTAEQKAELRAIMDRAARMRLNTIIFQVRPAGDALYASKLEPWSAVLTGRMGQAPSPFYDPLAFAIEEAHARGMELHAWFNPYRAKTPTMRTPAHASHVSRAKPSWVRTYGRHLWMDPGIADVRRHTIRVIVDVASRYDIDGIHLDDYFYPYQETNRRTRRVIPFPDDASYRRYRNAGGRLARNDWRRENVNTLVRELNDAVHAVKPWVKFGVSPFGIWRPGNPPGVAGLDSYGEIFADARTWVRNGWLDYVVPQLYWSLDRPQQPYVPLMAWWAQQNHHRRHLWIGNYTGRVREPGSNWPAEEIIRQIELTRGPYGASGNVHFNMTALMQDRDRVGTKLANGLYSEFALVPRTPWLDAIVPQAPRLMLDTSRGDTRVAIAPDGREAVRFWLVRTRDELGWSTMVLPGNVRTIVVAAEGQRTPAAVAISALDRTQNESEPAILVLRRELGER